MPWRIYNIGNSQPIELNRYIKVLEECLGVKAEKKLLPMQPGGIEENFADVGDLDAAVGYKPSTPVGEGVRRLAAWYRKYYGS